MQLVFDRQVRATLLGLWCLAWGIIAFLMLAPVSSPLTLSYADLIAHFLCFGFLAFSAVGFCHHSIGLGLLAALTIAGGVALELAQGLLPYRTVDILDIAADALGAMAGYGAAMAVLLLVIRPALDSRAADA